MWQFQQFIERISEELGRDGLIDNHLEFARGLRGGDVLGDDFSMLEARFPAVKNGLSGGLVACIACSFESTRSGLSVVARWRHTLPLRRLEQRARLATDGSKS